MYHVVLAIALALAAPLWLACSSHTDGSDLKAESAPDITLTPVEGDPFAGPRLAPVEGDPFSGESGNATPPDLDYSGLEPLAAYYVPTESSTDPLTPLPAATAAQFLDADFIVRCNGSDYVVEALSSTQRSRILDDCRAKNPGPDKLLFLLTINSDIDAQSLAILDGFASFPLLTGSSVHLNSAGGDIGIAMRMGEIVWDRQLFVAVPWWAKCYSACVLVYAASRHRVPVGEIGIHRITSDADLGTRQELQEAYGPIFESIARYLDSFGVSRQVVDLMRSVPSTQIRVLSKPELHDFGLHMTNVAAEELKRKNIEKKCGKDYASRYFAAEAEIEATCLSANAENMWNCLVEVRKRHGVYRTCDMSDG